MIEKQLTRRSLLLGAGMVAGAALALSGCATTTAGTVTTVTLNVAKVTAYAQAGLNAITTVTDALALFPGLSVYATPLAAVESVLATALANFTNAAGASITVAYDDASIKTRVDSVLSAIQSVASQIAAIITAMAKQSALGISDSNVSKVQLAYDALSTIISVFRALITSNVAMLSVSGPRLAMSEGQALSVLRA